MESINQLMAGQTNLAPSFRAAFEVVTPAKPSAPMSMEEWERAGAEYYRQMEARRDDYISYWADRGKE